MCACVVTFQWLLDCFISNDACDGANAPLFLLDWTENIAKLKVGVYAAFDTISCRFEKVPRQYYRGDYSGSVLSVVVVVEVLWWLWHIGGCGVECG